MRNRCKAILGISVGFILGLNSGAAAQRIGKNMEEVVQLANKEKNVRVASSWEPQNEPVLLKGFYQKYPGIKVTNTRTSGIDTRERIMNEALAGVVDHDLVNVSGELRNNYIKAGVMAGPFEWRKLLPKVKDVHFSPDGYFLASGFSKYIIVYNPTLVPKDRVPKKWEDCLDPYWKGKLVVSNPTQNLHRSRSGMGRREDSQVRPRAEG